MKQKLLSLPCNQYYLLTNRSDRKQVTTALTELIKDGSKFVFSEDGERFKRLACSFFDMVGQEGYTVRKVGISEQIFLGDKLLAVR